MTVSALPHSLRNGVGSPRLSDIEPVRLLMAEPSLGDALDPMSFDAARAKVVATSAMVDSSEAESPSSGRPGSDTTLLILSGLLLRRFVIAARPRAELLGPGDVIRPWDNETVGELPVEPSTLWCAARPTRVAVVDERVIESAAPWPPIVRELINRAVRRAHSLAVLLAASSLPRVEDRLCVVLWHLANRWGRVTPVGVRLDLPLTHELLAELVGAQRPTVTTALSQLCQDGTVDRDDDGSWLLGALGEQGPYVPPFAA